MTQKQFVETLLFVREDYKDVRSKILAHLKQLDGIDWASKAFFRPFRENRRKLVDSLTTRMRETISNGAVDDTNEHKYSFFFNATNNLVDAFLKELEEA